MIPLSGLGGEEERQAERGKESEQAAVYDGMEGLNTKAAKLRFGRDLRLLEVQSLLVMHHLFCLSLSRIATQMVTRMVRTL